MRRFQGSGALTILDDELMRAFVPAIRADYKAIETYACPAGTKISCPVTAFAGVADPITSLDQVAAWAECTSGKFYLRIFAGGHFPGWPERRNRVRNPGMPLRLAAAIRSH